tara:strand:- start:136 stop:501 length:366 start_codon:yes stop_codon:yes gene_type:complete
MYYAYHINFIPEAQSSKNPNHAVYGEWALFGQSLETLTGVLLTSEEFVSFANTNADAGYMSQLIALDNEADRELAIVDANEAFRLVLQTATPDGREFRLTKEQGQVLHNDLVASQPQTTEI